MIGHFLNVFPPHLEDEGKGQVRLLTGGDGSLHPNSLSGVQTHRANCLLDISPGYPTNHLKTNMSKCSPLFHFSRPLP